jgi:hypothetical protein
MAISPVTNGLSSGSNGLLSGNTSSSSGNSTTSNLNNALSGNGSQTIADQTSQALQELSDQVAAALSASASASSNVVEFEKSSQDVLYDNNATARQIGQLSINSSRLNVISALGAKDKIDTFQMNVASTGNTKFSILVNDPSNPNPIANSSDKVRVQIFAKGKGLVADSDAGAGAAHENYQALKNGTFSMSSGQYVIRVTRADGVDTQAKNPYNYAIQLTQGTRYSKDFTTTEQGYTEGTDDPFGLSNNANSQANILTDSLADSFSRINSLPPIGTSGTSKLLGMIYTGSF